jgi:hypothetical protein
LVYGGGDGHVRRGVVNPAGNLWGGGRPATVPGPISTIIAGSSAL